MVNKIWEFYEYLFYKYSAWSDWLNCGMNPFPYVGGWGFLTLLVFINFVTILCLVQILTGVGIDQFSNLPKIIIKLLR